MDRIFAFIGLFCALGIVALLSIGSIENDIKLPIIVPFVIVAGYSLSRMKP